MKSNYDLTNDVKYIYTMLVSLSLYRQQPNIYQQGDASIASKTIEIETMSVISIYFYVMQFRHILRCKF